MWNDSSIGSGARLATLLCCASMMLVVLSHRVFSARDVRHVISGHVRDPHHLRPQGAVLAVYAQHDGGVSGRPVAIGKDGAFVTPPLASGTYVLQISHGLYPAPDWDTVIGLQIARVDEDDLSGVSIEVRRDTAITGRFSMEGDRSLAEWPTSITVTAFLALEGMPMWQGVGTNGTPGRNFVLRNAFGPRVIRCGYVLSRGHAWWPSKVTLNGKDITNVPTDFSLHEDGQLEVAFTKTPARIAGTVTDADGEPVAAAWIIVNAAEPPLWQHWATTSDVTRADARGRFALPMLPGTYHVTAVSQTTFDSVKAARKAALQFASAGVTVSLNDQDVKNVILTVREP
jgi:hypothetical protein